jgi:TRAP-type C4-dicarboxylate transport system permease small subunit
VEIAKKTLNRSIWLYDRLCLGGFYFSAVLIMAIALSIGFSVLMRKGFDSPIDWVLQGTKYMLIYIAFLSAPQILRKNGHVRMTLLLERLPRKYMHMLNVFTSVVGAGVCAICLWQCGDATIQSFRQGIEFNEEFRFPQEGIYWVMPYGYFMLGIGFIRLAVENAFSARSDVQRDGPGVAQAAP